MSGTTQEQVSPSTGPPGCRGSPASETVSDHRLSSWELDCGLLTLPRVSFLRHFRISSGSRILAERWAPARPKGCAHPTLQSTLPVPLSTCAGSAKRGKGLFFLFFFGKHIYVYMYTHIFLSSSNSSSWKFAGQDQCLVAR